MIYLFEHRYTRVEVSDLKQIVEEKAKTFNRMGNICKELQARADFLTEN